ncbi:MAG: NRDE family protein [Paraglaciecola sp.]|nr:NRDE family protein [Paraglaciecola sp.]NCT47071.1 NRDE family protein [Paraglaciecola sp.]
MCILFVAVQQHPKYPLIIAANRDEFFARPTQASGFWPAAPEVLAGLDQQAGGTWMGVNKNGYVAALTNIRDPKTIRTDVISRGHLVSQYLIEPPQHYHLDLHATREQYNGYNLLYGHWQQLQVYNNHLDQHYALHPGVYGLSNASLNSPWPKIAKGTDKLQAYCQDPHAIHTEQLFELLFDSSLAPDHELPETGVPKDWEKRLSAIFIRGLDYGTRSSTVLTIDNQGVLDWHERSFNNQTTLINEQHFQFQLAK